MNQLDTEDFATLFDTDVSQLDRITRRIIDWSNFRYRPIQGDELEMLILKILRRIEGDIQIVGAPGRKSIWEDGWQENLDEFIESGFSKDALVPKFVRPGQALRYNQGYIFPEDPDFELNFVKVFRSWFLNEYFLDVENIYEFGCGTGYHLVAAAEIFPKKKYFGTDFVESSANLINTIAAKMNLALSGEVFDMKKPNYNYKIRPNSGIFTLGALEQLAGDIDAIFEYFLNQESEIFVHIEPAEELYDHNNLSDYLAYRFQTKRGYTSGLYPKLQKLEENGDIEILKARRVCLGSLFMEGYELFVWRKR